MASYIQGVTDFIPTLQPFRPDLNYYSNILSAKQSQYDQTHKQISQAYGTLMNSPMLRDGNIQRRDQFFKNVEQNIKKISKLDLSQEQNVNAAMQAFSPLYQDKYIMKDMVYTKQLQNEMARAENFRNCVDPDKCGGQYWNEGVQAMQYKAEEFKNASDEDSLSMSAPKFAPKIDVFGKATKLAKDMGFNVTKVGFSGNYIVTKKNGEALEAPLYNFFISKFREDPSVQEMYQTQAYVQRKGAAKSYAAQHGVSEDVGEQLYLNDRHNQIEKAHREALAAVNNNARYIDGKKRAIEKTLEERNGATPEDPIVKAYLNLAEAGAVTEDAKKHHELILNTIDRGTTAGMSVEALRHRIDSAVAGSMFDYDMKMAAKTYSELNSEEKVEVNPISLEYIREAHAERMQRNLFAHQDLEGEKQREHAWQMAIAKGQIVMPSPDTNEWRKIKAEGGSPEAYDELSDFGTTKDAIVNGAKSLQTEYLKDIATFYGNKNPETFKKIFGVGYKPGMDITTIPGFDNKVLDMYTKASAEAQKDRPKDPKGGGGTGLMDATTFVKLQNTQTSLSDVNERLGKMTELNNQNSKNIETQVILDEGLNKPEKAQDFVNWKLFFSDKGAPVTPSEFNARVNTYKKQQEIALSKQIDVTKARIAQDAAALHSGTLSKDEFLHSPHQSAYNSLLTRLKDLNKINPEKIYNENYVKYRKAYQEGLSAGPGTALVQSFRSLPGMGGFGEGMAGFVQEAVVDPANKNSKVFKDYANISDAVLTNLDNPETTTVSALSWVPGGENKLEGYEKEILRAFINDTRYNQYTGKDVNRPTGRVQVSTAPGGDPNKVQVTFYPPEKWTASYEGKEKRPGITWDPNMYRNGITVIMPKNAVAGNPYFAHSDDDYVKQEVAVSPVTVNVDRGGQVVLSKSGSGYQMEIKEQTFNPSTGKWEFNVDRVPVNSEVNLTVARDKARQVFKAKADMNAKFEDFFNLKPSDNKTIKTGADLTNWANQTANGE